MCVLSVVLRCASLRHHQHVLSLRLHLSVHGLMINVLARVEEMHLSSVAAAFIPLGFDNMSPQGGKVNFYRLNGGVASMSARFCCCLNVCVCNGN